MVWFPLFKAQGAFSEPHEALPVTPATGCMDALFPEVLPGLNSTAWSVMTAKRVGEFGGVPNPQAKDEWHFMQI